MPTNSSGVNVVFWAALTKYCGRMRRGASRARSQRTVPRASSFCRSYNSCVPRFPSTNGSPCRLAEELFFLTKGGVRFAKVLTCRRPNNVVGYKIVECGVLVFCQQTQASKKKKKRCANAFGVCRQSGQTNQSHNNSRNGSSDCCGLCRWHAVQLTRFFASVPKNRSPW